MNWFIQYTGPKHRNFWVQLQTWWWLRKCEKVIKKHMCYEAQFKILDKVVILVGGYNTEGMSVEDFRKVLYQDLMEMRPDKSA